MNAAEDMHDNKYFPIVSLLSIIVFSALSYFAITQYRHNIQLQKQLDALTIVTSSRSPYDEELQEKIDRIIDVISDEPRLSVQDMLSGRRSGNNDGEPSDATASR